MKKKVPGHSIVGTVCTAGFRIVSSPDFGVETLLQIDRRPNPYFTRGVQELEWELGSGLANPSRPGPAGRLFIPTSAMAGNFFLHARLLTHALSSRMTILTQLVRFWEKKDNDFRQCLQFPECRETVTKKSAISVDFQQKFEKLKILKKSPARLQKSKHFEIGAVQKYVNVV